MIVTAILIQKSDTSIRLISESNSPSVNGNPTNELLFVNPRERFKVEVTTKLDPAKYKLRLRRFVPGVTGSRIFLASSDDKKSSVTNNGDGTVTITAEDVEFQAGTFGIGLDATDCATGKPADDTIRLYSVRSSRKGENNGLLAGQVKQYDADSLLLMMQGLSSQLSGLQLIGGAGLTNSFGQFQGASATSSWLGAQATTQPIPGVTTTSGAPVTSSQTQQAAGATTVISTIPTTQTTNSGTTQNSGTQQTTVVAPNGQTTTTTNAGGTLQTVTTAPQVSAPLVAAPSQISPYSYNPSFGPGPQSMLQDQVDVTYQIFNLQMLLQGSLTDRYFGLPEAGSDSSPYRTRYRTVIGVPVSIDPGPKYKGAVAEVEVSLCSRQMTTGAPSLVAMMPMQNSYNVVSMTQDARQLQLGANVSIFSLGVNAGRASQTVYLQRDTDTLALQRSTEDSEVDKGGSAKFAWQFRPVLGEASVRGGTRTLFASLALPVSMTDNWTGYVHLVTRWRRYDAKHRIVGEVIPGSVHDQDLQELDFAPGMKVEGQSGASIYQATWQDAGDGKNVTIDVDGVNFINGTTAHAGPNVYGTANGLNLSSRSVSFTMPAGLLGISDPYIVSPHGIAVRIRQKGSVDHPEFPFSITKASWKAIDDTNGAVTLEINTLSDFWRPVGPSDAPDPHIFNPDDDPLDHLSVSPVTSKGSTLDKRPIRLLAEIGGQVFGLEGNPLIVDLLSPSSGSGSKGTLSVQEKEAQFAIRTSLLEIATSQRIDAGKTNVSVPNDQPMVPYRITFVAPLTTLKTAQNVKLMTPLWGEYSVQSAKLTALKAKTSGFKFALLRFYRNAYELLINLDKDWAGDTPTLTVGDEELHLLKATDDGVYRVSIRKESLVGVKKVVLKGGGGAIEIVTLDLDTALEDTPVPITLTETVHVNDEIHVTLTGRDLSGVCIVLYDGHPCPADHKGKDMKVMLDRRITKTAGKKELTLISKRGAKEYVPVTVLP